jgi:hypothetical protein
MKRNFSTVRALIGDLAKRNRARMGLQLVKTANPGADYLLSSGR